MMQMIRKISISFRRSRGVRAGVAASLILAGSAITMAFGAAFPSGNIYVGTGANDSASTLPGTEGGADYLDGEGGADVLSGLGTHDSVFGVAGNDTLYGGTGSDLVFGTFGNDVLSGGPEHDYISGGPGSDQLHGADGDFDIIIHTTNDSVCRADKKNSQGLGAYDQVLIPRPNQNDYVADNTSCDRIYVP